MELVQKLYIFLATPITPLMITPNRFDPEAEKSIESILSTLRVILDAKVFCAIEREKFGKELMTGIECTRPDYLGLESSDIILAFPDHSYGVHLELGWASALQKPIIICLNTTIGIKTPLIEGLSTLTNVIIVEYKSAKVLPSNSNWENELFPKVLAAIELIQASRSKVEDRVLIYAHS